MTTTNKKLDQPTFNSQAWDVPLNSNFGVIDTALGSAVTISLTSSNYTMSTSEAQNLRIAITGTITTSLSIIIPDNIGGFWIVTNDTVDSVVGANNTVTVKTVSGSGITITRGYATIVYDTGSSVAVGNILNALSDRLSIAGGTLIGNLIIGASSASGSTLTINNTGTANALVVSGGNTTIGGNGTTTGNLTAQGNVTAYSDARLKEDILEIEDALNKVMQLRGVTYLTKGDLSNRRAGVIAQEMREVLPEVVFEDAEGYMHVAYGNIVSLLINAVKELSRKVDALGG